jgi:peroxiredoxin
MGVDLDMSKFGMGTRNQRYAAVLQDGIVTHLALEGGTGLEVSTADATLAALS